MCVFFSVVEQKECSLIFCSSSSMHAACACVVGPWRGGAAKSAQAPCFDGARRHLRYILVPR